MCQIVQARQLKSALNQNNIFYDFQKGFKELVGLNRFSCCHEQPIDQSEGSDHSDKFEEVNDEQEPMNVTTATTRKSNNESYRDRALYK